MEEPKLQGKFSPGVYDAKDDPDATPEEEAPFVAIDAQGYFRLNGEDFSQGWHAYAEEGELDSRWMAPDEFWTDYAALDSDLDTK